jgi:hypothetical protein
MSRPIYRRWWLTVPLTFALAILLVAIYIYFFPRTVERRIRATVTGALSERFHSDVDLDDLQVKPFATPNVIGKGLTIRNHHRTDVPPLIRVERFSFNVGIMGLLRPVKSIALIRVQNVLVTIPPRDRSNAHQSSSSPISAPRIVIDQLICDNLDIRILPRNPAKPPLDWDIHNLLLTSAGLYKPFAFHGNLTNGKPTGEIVTHGRFGPWDADDPGGTPVSGEYDFSNADLGPFPGIAGILSSSGKYDGQLSDLEVSGHTDTPDFSLDRVGKPVPLHTEFSATVDGTDGDTYLHPVNATLVHSLIVAVGKVVRVPEKQGHMISIEATVPNGRIQDFLNLAVNSDKPFLTGPVKIKAKLTIPPGQERLIQKMIFDGQFGVDDANWTSPELREKLESLSRQALGKPQDEEIGSSVSDLTGAFLLKDGVLLFRRLNFSVEGAEVQLAGTYGLQKGDLDLSGHLRLQAKLSQTTTGAKSFFLKAVDPFFAKNGAGTVLPIRITGTRQNPIFSVTVFHKTFDKHLSADTAGKPKM